LRRVSIPATRRSSRPLWSVGTSTGSGPGRELLSRGSCAARLWRLMRASGATWGRLFRMSLTCARETDRGILVALRGPSGHYLRNSRDG
jgi:hypothetical protein